MAVKSMDIKLTPTQAEIIKHRLETGKNHSQKEVLDEALRLLIEDEVLSNVDLNELNASLDRTRAQFDSGKGVEWNLQEFLA